MWVIESDWIAPRQIYFDRFIKKTTYKNNKKIAKNTEVFYSTFRKEGMKKYVIFFLMATSFINYAYALGSRNLPSPTVTPTPMITAPSAFDRPWEREDTSIVIDAYEDNGIDWNKMAKDKKMVGIIHRSSIGLVIDKKYLERRKIASERGYLWGAYHLGRRGNTIQQADLFLSLIEDTSNTLMILDLEDTGSSNFMSIDEAVIFMDYIYEKSGRIPTVYANHSTTIKINSLLKNNALFHQAKLWYARFRSNIPDFPKGLWSNYFLWQFSSEINCSKTGSCLYNVPGTDANMDINVFNGPESELRSMWNNE